MGSLPESPRCVLLPGVQLLLGRGVGATLRASSGSTRVPVPRPPLPAHCSARRHWRSLSGRVSAVCPSCTSVTHLACSVVTVQLSGPWLSQLALIPQRLWAPGPRLCPISRSLGRQRGLPLWMGGAQTWSPQALRTPMPISWKGPSEGCLPHEEPGCGVEWGRTHSDHPDCRLSALRNLWGETLKHSPKGQGPPQREARGRGHAWRPVSHARLVKGVWCFPSHIPPPSPPLSFPQRPPESPLLPAKPELRESLGTGSEEVTWSLRDGTGAGGAVSSPSQPTTRHIAPSPLLSTPRWRQHGHQTANCLCHLLFIGCCKLHSHG